MLSIRAGRFPVFAIERVIGRASRTNLPLTSESANQALDVIVAMLAAPVETKAVSNARVVVLTDKNRRQS